MQGYEERESGLIVPEDYDQVLLPNAENFRRLGDPWFNRLGFRGIIPWGNHPGGYGGVQPYYEKVLVLFARTFDI